VLERDYRRFLALGKLSTSNSADAEIVAGAKVRRKQKDRTTYGQDALTSYDVYVCWSVITEDSLPCGKLSSTNSAKAEIGAKMLFLHFCLWG
jgi:hypothetical protein